jgi:hypothetical protein
MAEKKAKPKAEPKVEQSEDKSRPAMLILRNPYKSIILDGRLIMDGKPDGIQFMGASHRVMSNTENQIIIQRVCDDPDKAIDAYLAAGWKHAK